ncbi:hypothetical protein CNMCM5623_005184 [Aspergillus felis]|uniref:Uncharacterized protein n=1 Tax=Aspergillus felis TaxID=1287682 RepID=A0A8H6PRQ4_9EURO|nr:hypothetical protein CNMCM5623_005184 [Aspergillus felis]
MTSRVPEELPKGVQQLSEPVAVTRELVNAPDLDDPTHEQTAKALEIIMIRTMTMNRPNPSQTSITSQWDDDYEPQEVLPDTEEIMAISNNNHGEGQPISAAEVVAEVRATQPEAEPIGTLKEDHSDPRRHRVVFLRFDHKGVVTLRLVNTTVTTPDPAYLQELEDREAL